MNEELENAIRRAQTEVAAREAEEAARAKERSAEIAREAPAHAEAFEHVTAAAAEFWPRAERCHGPRDDYGYKIGSLHQSDVYVGDQGRLLVGSRPLSWSGGRQSGGFKPLQAEHVTAELASGLIAAMGSWLATAEPGRKPKRPRDKSWLVVHVVAAAILIAAASIAYPEAMATAGAYVLLAVIALPCSGSGSRSADGRDACGGRVVRRLARADDGRSGCVELAQRGRTIAWARLGCRSQNSWLQRAIEASGAIASGALQISHEHKCLSPRK